MGPKLIGYSSNGKLEMCAWQNPKDWTQEEVNVCTKYYQLQSRKLGMNIQRYMKEFY
jgi:hypothetical protein